MNLRHTKGIRRGAQAAAVASAMVFALSACGSGGGGEGDGEDKKSASTKESEEEGAPSEVDTDKVIGEIKGADGVVVRVHSAVRDEGGFVTVNATLSNEGDKPLPSNRWRSTETVMKSKSSISGATLVDPVGKKRYMILRDTDGECLCTTGLTSIKPEESRPIYAQFPAPPAKTKKVDFQLPGMSPARVDLSEG